MFQLRSNFNPTGDQPQAIEKICHNINTGAKQSALLGVTGSGKTFTMAHVIQRLDRPALILAPNKTLAAQLFSELKQFFPQNAVEYFISYYDYYQPEAYVPNTDTYIAKDSAINEDIDKMRHAATQSLLERRDVIIVSSVSCIYGLGNPDAYAKLVVSISRGEKMERDVFLRKLVDIQYSREDGYLTRGHFRVRGDIVDVMPAHQRDEALRIEFFGDEIERVLIIDALTGQKIREVENIGLYPNSHYVTDRSDMGAIVKEILTDLGIRLRELKALGKVIEYQRLEQRTMNDIELMEHLGFCPGIENYSRYINGMAAGEPPPTLLDYFPKDFLTIIDESHITVPQIGGMYRGDRARKSTLVDYGFRLPAALDNRPVNFDEFLQKTGQILHVSATLGTYELKHAEDRVAEQIIRPTGLVDPPIEVQPIMGQVDRLYGMMREVIERGGRVLVTTLTKKMAEDLTLFYRDMNIKVRYLHSDIESLERVELLRDLRKGVFDVLIGINLLREGLDLPEVQLVAVMDCDKEGFLRSRASLIQIIGRAARNTEGRVIFFADRITESMRLAMEETDRRRTIQREYNEMHGIVPTTIIKAIPEDMRKIYGLIDESEDIDVQMNKALMEEIAGMNFDKINALIAKKVKKMKLHAGKFEFEEAAALRDEVRALKEFVMTMPSKDEADV